MTAHTKLYLQEMGIEVWALREKRRGPGAAPVHPVAHATVPEVAAPPRAASASRPADMPAAQAPVPQFDLGFASGSHITLVFCLPKDTAGVGRRIRRLVADIMLALEGITDAPTSALSWPMVQARHIDQSADAARVVLRQRLERCAPYLLVFGDEPARWIDDLSSRRSTLVKDIRTYLEAPLTKRELWQHVLQVRAEATP